jgi:hypothetical protein
VFQGSDYSDEEREFLTAIESYKRHRRRPFPTWREVLHVAHCLGYRRVAERREILSPLSPCGRGVGGEGSSPEIPLTPNPSPAKPGEGDRSEIPTVGGA